MALKTLHKVGLDCQTSRGRWRGRDSHDANSATKYRDQNVAQESWSDKSQIAISIAKLSPQYPSMAQNGLFGPTIVEE